MADNTPPKDHRIIAKIVLQASLCNTSPLLIGKGEGDTANSEVMVWTDGRPYIPASSLVGCLKSYHRTAIDSESEKKRFKFWGNANNEDPHQSHLRVDDLLGHAHEADAADYIRRRDGVRIEAKKGTAEDAKKYDYQLVESGLTFDFRAEITVRASMDLAEAKAFAGEIAAILTHANFRVGAQSNTGFGKLSCENIEGWLFDFDKKSETHTDAWLAYCSDETQVSGADPIDLSQAGDIEDNSFVIDAEFRLKSSLMIGAYNIDSGEQPDKSQLKNRDGSYALPGKSIRGALRHRALRILNIIDSDQAEERLYALFGNVDESKEEIRARRGRLRIEESRIDKDAVQSMVQERIRIDRFTGGVINAALFNSEPVWKTGEERIRISMRILNKAKPREIELLLFLLKDLWLEDLPIGGEKGIGRGLLSGSRATISNQGAVVARIERKADAPAHEIILTPDNAAAAIQKLILSTE